MEGLSDILDRPPYQHVKRTRVVAPSALDDPVRTLRGAVVAGPYGELGLALFRDRPQVVGRRVSL